MGEQETKPEPNGEPWKPFKVLAEGEARIESYGWMPAPGVSDFIGRARGRNMGEDETKEQAFESYRITFKALADASDKLSLALTAWHAARTAAEQAWESVPEREREICYSPRCLSLTRRPDVKGVIRPPEHIPGLCITAENCPPQ